MPNALQASGSQGRKQTAAAPIFVNRMFTGLWTQRNPLREAATQHLVEKFYTGARFDSIIDGLNVEISNRLTIRRRCGASVYNSQSFPAIQRFYEFRQTIANAETISLIADTAATIYDATGPSTKTAIFSKSAGAGQSYFQSVGNVLYFGDGVDQTKYLFIGGMAATQNWGIVNSSSSTSLLTASTISASGTPFGHPALAFGQGLWSTSAGVSSATLPARTGFGDFASSNNLLALNFGFAVSVGPAGIEINFSASVSVADNNTSLTVQLVKNGIPVGTPKTIAGSQLSATPTPFTLGNTSDLWGTTLSASDLNQSNFGFAFRLAKTAVAVASTLSITDNTIQAQAFLGNQVTAVPFGSGSFAAVNGGFRYEQCYGNNVPAPEVMSSPTLPTLPTGNFSGKQGVNVTLTASPDAQVTGIHVFRTDDGGGTFFELPASPYPNVNAVIVDAAGPSGTPGGTNLFSIAPLQHENDPPPAGLINLTYHLGCIFGSVGNTMYFSDGPRNPFNGNEAFPPSNNFVLPSLITRYVPLTIGMLIFTTAGVYFSGIGGVNGDLPTQPVPFMQGKVGGLLSYNALDVVGSTIYLVNSKRMVKAIDISAGESEIGFPVGDFLAGKTSVGGIAAGIDPANCYVSFHEQDSTDSGLYLATPGAANAAWWLRLNPTPAPETGMSWSPPAVSTFGFTAVQSIETSPGIHQLLLGPPSGSGAILYRDPTVFADNTIAYPAYVDIGSLVMAHPGQAALLYFITVDAVAVGARPQVSVLMNEIGGHPAMGTLGSQLKIATPDPPQLGPAESLTLYNDRFWLSGSQKPAWCRHLQMEIAWPAENQPNELLTYTLFGEHYQEV